MQHRMRDFQLSEKEIQKLLTISQVGHLATVYENGFPYITPVHFVLYQGKIYIHGLSAGDKIDNISRDSRVCFEVEDLTGIKNEKLESPCKADAAYKSVIIMGTARLMDQISQKEEILNIFVDKYVPSMKSSPLSERKVSMTAVIEITVDKITGKYHE